MDKVVDSALVEDGTLAGELPDMELEDIDCEATELEPSEDVAGTVGADSEETLVALVERLISPVEIHELV